MSSHDPHSPDAPDTDALPPGAPPHAPPDEASAGGLTFSPLVDGFAAVLVIGWIIMMFSMLYGSPAVERTAHPDRALELIVAQWLDLDAALEAAPEWERTLYVHLLLGEEGGLTDAIRWYDELLAHTEDPGVGLRLAILEGEAGRLERVRARVGTWTEDDRADPLRRRLIEAAYLGARLDPIAETRLQAERAELLPEGWFSDRLALRLAEQAGNDARRAASLRATRARGAVLLARVHVFLVIETLLFLSGLVLLLVWLLPRRGDPAAARVGAARIPPPWPGRTGLLVLLRGTAAGVLVTMGFLLAGPGPIAARLLLVPLINAPVLVLAARHLLRPRGLDFRTGLGVGLRPGGGLPLLLVIPILSAAGLALDWVVALLTTPLNLTMHWTDWFDPELAWGSGLPLAAALVEYLIFAPVFEEIVFRGLLFGTLRRRFAFAPAALLSALLFALAHGYGLVGLVSVCVSGMIWAWAYERTGSLLPGMLAHFLNNLLVCAGVMAMLR